MKVQLPLSLEGEGGWTNRGKHWENSTLRTASIGLEVCEMPLAGLDLNTSPWYTGDFFYTLYHFKRVEAANLKYPILLDPNGTIIDGWHRIAKAILKGDETISFQRLLVMPEHDRLEPVE